MTQNGRFPCMSMTNMKNYNNIHVTKMAYLILVGQQLALMFINQVEKRVARVTDAGVGKLRLDGISRNPFEIVGKMEEKAT